jgi:hypothetical protein
MNRIISAFWKIDHATGGLAEVVLVGVVGAAIALTAYLVLSSLVLLLFNAKVLLLLNAVGS